MTGRPAGIAAVALSAVSMAYLLWHLVAGMSLVTFYDEATHVVGGKMLDTGGVLYRDFVDSHGPFIFMLAQLYGRLFGWSHANGTRAIVAGFALLAGLSLAGSDAFAHRRERLRAITLFGLLLGVVWWKQGLYLFSFYPIGGALAAIGLTGFAIGGPIGGRNGSRLAQVQAFGAGLALIGLGSMAYSFAPTMLLFGLAGCWNARRRRRLVGCFAAGLAVGLVLLTAWMLQFASLRGYLAFHLAESQFVYSRYIDFSWHRFLHSLAPSMAPQDRVLVLANFCTAAGSLILGATACLRRDWASLPSVVAVCAGVLALNARGAALFQNGSYVIAAIVLASVAIARGLDATRSRYDLPATGCVWLVAAMAIVFTHDALYTPFAFDRTTFAATPHWPIGDRADGGYFRDIREDAGPDGRILALAYDPQLYLLADRLPMDGFYTWFPWDADYARAPWFGMSRDLCVALRQRPPPVIVVDEAPFWGIRPRDYMPCVFETLARDYAPDNRATDLHGTIYVRRDRVAPHR